MEKSIKIVSDGSAIGTKVYTADGQEIRGITRISIEPVKPGGFVRASIEFVQVELEVIALADDTRKVAEVG